MLDYGVELATRPGEFLTLGQDPNGRFWVRSAKHSVENRRALLPARTVPTDTYEAWEIAELQTVIQLIAEERAQGATFSKLLRRCQHAIRQARANVGGRSRRLTAYSVRHQARANYVAMGHYASGRHAWRGMSEHLRPKVDPALVALVRPSHPSRGWNPALVEAPVPRP
jgi:hypothetical protein